MPHRPPAAPRATLRALALVATLASVAWASPAAAAAGCSLAGHWAVSYEIPLVWRGNAGVEGGRGTLWVGGVVVREDLGAGRYAEVLHVCGRRPPVTRTLLLYGGERYGSALDLDGVPFAQLPRAEGTLQLDVDGDHFAVDPLVVDYGLSDAGGAFPKGTAASLQRACRRPQDNRFGVRLVPRTDDGLRLPPTNALRSRRAVTLDAVLRDTLASSGQVHGCDAMSGEVSVPDVPGQPGLAAQLIGCATDGADDCTRTELALMNTFAPNFRPERGSVHMVRLADGAGCAEALAALLP